MKTLPLDLGERGYPIHIGPGLLARPELVVPHLPGVRVAIVTNETVAPLYLEKARAGLVRYDPVVVILPDGEQYKTLEVLGRIFDALLAARCDRQTTVIALGGGVVGDMAGFAAAVYQRGVPFIQMPTTLLAMVDSSVGGKTGVNHPLGKNMIGAFHQPRAVLIDTDTLATLPDRQLSAGLAEVIKYGLIRDAEFFAWLEGNMEALLARVPEALIEAIYRSCRNKAEVVAADERESGVRAILNFGHTFGHAIETGLGYGAWLHGEAVAAGMIMAVDLSCRLGWLTDAEVRRIESLVQRARLPVRPPPALTPERWRELMSVDKKARAGKLRLVLLKRLGEAVITGDYPPAALEATLNASCAAAQVESKMILAPYAARDETSRGRRYFEPKPAYRGEYQRDRDRIIHCAAFRRLEYKTQVFVNHEGDLFRTRLTHSLEVAQIARTVARALGLNEDLTEAIALAHDLGHTPFGHAGQEALDECMRDYGGFEHNWQSLRVVDELEERYAEFPGLNLTFETREGILKHCSPEKARVLGELGERFLTKRQPSLEAQLVNLADEIAYNNHDVDDGLRYGHLDLEELQSCALFAEQYRAVRQRYPALAVRRAIHETVRRMIDRVVTDLVEESRRRIEASGVRSIEEVRRQDAPLIAYGPEVREQTLELKRFLRQRLYAHPRVRQRSQESIKIVRELFAAFMEDPRRLPSQYQDKLRACEAERGSSGRARLVADYIAGMTDRYALHEHSRLFGTKAP